MKDVKITNKENNKKASFMEQYKLLLQETIIAPTDNYDVKIKPINDLIRENMPQSLYRFRPINENSIEAFWKDTIYHSNPDKFNDPHDCLVFIDKKGLVDKIKGELTIGYLQDLVKQWQNWEQMPDSFFYPYTKESPEVQAAAKKFEGITVEKVQELFYAESEKLNDVMQYSVKILENVETVMYEHFRSYPKIACFGENILSTLMWAHYADYHKGFALEYDFRQNQSKCLECQNPCNDFSFMNLYPVIYGNERYNATYLAYYFFNNERLKASGFPSIPIPDQFYSKANLYKGMDWEYEKEWRSILTCIGNQNNHKVTVKPKSIYIGTEISPVHQDILVNYAKAKEIKIYKMKVDTYSDEYKLTYDEWNDYKNEVRNQDILQETRSESVAQNVKSTN